MTPAVRQSPPKALRRTPLENARAILKDHAPSHGDGAACCLCRAAEREMERLTKEG